MLPTDAVKGVADKIKSFLHFSVPDEGPLTDYQSWMPDFMGGLADGISASEDTVLDKVKGVAITNVFDTTLSGTIRIGGKLYNSTTGEIFTDGRDEFFRRADERVLQGGGSGS